MVILCTLIAWGAINALMYKLLYVSDKKYIHRPWNR